MKKPLPTLLVDPDALAPVAIVVGDPKRALAVANRLNHAEEVGSNREYVTWTGTYDGRWISVSAHGVGAAGANVCFEELLRGGVDRIIRAGTCGAIQPDLADGDLIIAPAAVREDAVSEHLISLAYPAAADREMTGELVLAAGARGGRAHEGLVVTEANFYPGSHPPRWRQYAPYGALAVEMELASLYVIAAMHGARAAGILTVDGNLVSEGDPDMSDYDPHRQVVAEGVETMLDIAVQAAARISETRTR